MRERRRPIKIDRIFLIAGGLKGPVRALLSASVVYALSVGLASLVAWSAPAQETRVQAKTHPKHRISGKWKVRAGGYSFVEDTDEGILAQLKARSKLKYGLGAKVDLTADIELFFNSGRVQTQFDEDQTGNAVRLREALARYRPIRSLLLAAGIVGQAHLKSNLLISSRRAFPGLKQKLTVPRRWGKLWVTAQQTVPTSESFDLQRSEKEPTPTLITETVGAEYQRSRETSARAYITHYAFNKLPNVVAAYGYKEGNRVFDPAPLSQFEYGFNGFLAGFDGEMSLSPKAKLLFKGQWLQNNSAPVGLSRGQMWSMGMQWKQPDFVVTPTYEQFFNEAHTSPAYYNSSSYGHNNRQGFAAQLSFDFEKEGYLLAARYVRSDVINDRLNQDRLETIQLFVETHYADF